MDNMDKQDQSQPSHPQPGPDVPQTIEGFYVLHDIYNVDWAALRSLSSKERARVADEAVAWLGSSAATAKGDTAAYSIITQKGDVMLLHYRETPDELSVIEHSLKQIRVSDYLLPAYSYLSVIEVSLYEVLAIAMKRLAESGINPKSSEFEQAKAEEIAKQRAHMDGRLYRDVPAQKYVSFYPMNKKRGDQTNWYALPLDERRAMMRGHGTIGHKYHEHVTQVISGSVGLDDWEWGVDLHSDDTLIFKKLIYEMRFDPASALYAEFGPFYTGIRRSAGEIGELLAGRSVA
jgi:chlorite dismutase